MTCLHQSGNSPVFAALHRRHQKGNISVESGSTLAQAEEGLRESVSEEDRGREGKGIRLNERHLCLFITV